MSVSVLGIMKLLTFSVYEPFRTVHVHAVHLSKAAENTNYLYCVNSVRWLAELDCC